MLGKRGRRINMEGKGLIIKGKWLDKIFNHGKVWEIRGSNTKIRGKIYLIESGTGMIVGQTEIIDSYSVNTNDLELNKHNHCIEDMSIVKYKNPHAWILKNAIEYIKPIPYKHPQGAVIWVNVNEVLE